MNQYNTIFASSSLSLSQDSTRRLISLVRKLMSLIHGQELGKLADIASDWLFNYSRAANQEPVTRFDA